MEEMLNFTDGVGDLLKDLGIPEDSVVDEQPQELPKEEKEQPVDDAGDDTDSKEKEEKELDGFVIGDEDKDTPPKTDVKKDVRQDSILSSIANTLLEEGYFTLDEGEELKINSPEEFVGVLDKIRENALLTEQEDWTDHQKEYFEALRAGIPHEQVVQHQQTQQAYSSITDEVLEDETDDAANLRKNILIAGFKARGFDDNKASKWADKSIKDGSDVDDAKEFLEELKQSEKDYFNTVKDNQKKAQEESRKKMEEESKEFKTYINSVKEIIPGKPLTPKMRKELMDGVTKPVYTDEKTGQSYNALGDYIRRNGQKGIANLVHILKVTDEFKKAEVLSTSKARKSVVDKLDQTLSRPSTGLEFTKDDPVTEFDYESSLDIIDKSLQY